MRFVQPARITRLWHCASREVGGLRVGRASVLNEIYHSLDPVAFSIGPYEARWYGIAYVLGFLLAGLVMFRTSKRWRLGLSGDHAMVIVLSVAVGVIVGARLFYVLFYGLSYYIAHPSHILLFNEGGMSFHGGLVGGIVGGAIACRVLGISFFTMLDLCVIGAPIGLFFGRIANFINGELWGKPTDLPWGVVFETGGSVARHPSQLYEAILEGAVIFIVLFVLSRRVPPRPRGTFIGTFLTMYGVFRFLIEFVREPDAQLGYLFGGWVTMGQVLSAPLVVAGIAILILAHKRKCPQSLRTASPTSEIA
jgi:phosphatidylglycerol:prolipoprotein diacylglycerol transferase